MPSNTAVKASTLLENSALSCKTLTTDARIKKDTKQRIKTSAFIQYVKFHKSKFCL